MKSKCTKSSMPSFFSWSTTDPKFERRISGYVCSCRSFLNDASVYRRKHFPGRVRPARPALWCAEAREMGDTSSDSTRMRGLYTFCLENPGSITYTMPSMVRDVSAMFVETTIFLPAMPLRGGGASSKILCCCCGGRDAYRGTTLTSPTLSPALPISRRIFMHASSISSSPVRKMRMSPGGSHAWICTAVRMAASR